MNDEQRFKHWANSVMLKRSDLKKSHEAWKAAQSYVPSLPKRKLIGTSIYGRDEGVLARYDYPEKIDMRKAREVCDEFGVFVKQPIMLVYRYFDDDEQGEVVD